MYSWTRGQLTCAGTCSSGEIVNVKKPFSRTWCLGVNRRRVEHLLTTHQLRAPAQRRPDIDVHYASRRDPQGRGGARHGPPRPMSASAALRRLISRPPAALTRHRSLAAAGTSMHAAARGPPFGYARSDRPPARASGTRTPPTLIHCRHATSCVCASHRPCG